MKFNKYSETEYLWISEHSKKTKVKNFFKRLSIQKEMFCLRIENKIQNLENELVLIEGELEKNNTSSSCKLLQLPLHHYEKNEFFRKCYFRERSGLKLYEFFLKQIHAGSIRELLLFQRHHVKINLKEIESMGLYMMEESHNAFNGEDSYYKKGS